MGGMNPRNTWFAGIAIRRLNLAALTLWLIIEGWVS